MTKRSSLLVLTLLMALPQLAHSEAQQSEKTFFDKLSGAIGPLFTPSKENPLYKEWLKAKIDFDVKVFDKSASFNLGKHPISIGAGLKYHYTLAPAFIRNLHHRFDIYSLNANAGSTLFENIGIGAGISATLTFARLYEDKVEAGDATPYFLNRAPWTADRAIHYLLPGEMSRLEMSLNGSIGTGKSEDYGHGANGNVGLSASGGSSLVLDVYRMKEENVRVRIVGSRTNGTINISAGVGLTKALDFGLGIINRLTKGAIQVTPLSLGTSFSPIQVLPMDTMMFDYIFDLSNLESKVAYNQLMSKIYYLQFTEYLKSLLSEKTLGNRMLEYVKPVENLYLKYKAQQIGTRPVDRIFKGRTETNFWSSYANTNFKILTTLLRKNFDMYTSRSFVRGFDRDDEAIDLIYMVNNKSSKFEALFGWFKTSSLDGIQILFPGKRVEKEKKLEVIPTSVSDLIFTRNIQDDNLSDHQIAEIKYYIQSSTGASSVGLNWDKIEKAKSKTNGYIHSQIVFHQEIIQELAGKLSASEIYTQLRRMVDQHPFKLYLPVTLNTQNIGGDLGNSIFDKYEEDIREIAYKLSTFLNDPNYENKIEAFGALRIFNLFNEIGPAFIVANLPPDRVKDLTFVRVNAGSEAGSLITHVSGKEDVSQLYSSLQFMLAVINDRSFDLRVQLDGNNMQIFKMKGDATQVCANCDTTSSMVVEKLPSAPLATEAKNE